jgi:hypothetical protein
VGEGNKTINKLKKIIIGGMWGMSDTCTKEKFLEDFY